MPSEAMAHSTKSSLSIRMSEKRQNILLTSKRANSTIAPSSCRFAMANGQSSFIASRGVLIYWELAPLLSVLGHEMHKRHKSAMA
jgi:hypothetical protein